MPEFAHLTLKDAAALLNRGEVSSVELTRECLGRAERLNATLNCFVRIDAEPALAEAAASDARRAAGRPTGRLEGVPIALKDMFYSPGTATSGGSRILATRGATREATVLTRLKAEGAVNLGTLSMTEFAFGPTGHNAVYGACRNPWNPEYIAGGSSSGAGSALAARLAFGALGSDTGGSIRGPASVNGVLGLKPTYGRVSRHGAMPLSWSIDHIGPMARTAADLARLLAVIAGHDPLDATSSRHAVPDYEAATRGDARGLVVGIPRNFFFEGVGAPLKGVLDAALGAFGRAGARLVEVEVPSPSDLTELGRTIMYSESAAVHGEWLRARPDDYSPQIRARAATGLAIPAACYVEALELRAPLLRRFVEGVFSTCDVLATPTLAVPVPTLASTDVGGSPAMWQTIAALVRCVAPFNFLGLPALSVPAGFLDGLPVGLQLVGRPFAEAVLLKAAAAYQGVTDWHERRPALS